MLLWTGDLQTREEMSQRDTNVWGVARWVLRWRRRCRGECP